MTSLQAGGKKYPNIHGRDPDQSRRRSCICQLRTFLIWYRRDFNSWFYEMVTCLHSSCALSSLRESGTCAGAILWPFCHLIVDSLPLRPFFFYIGGYCYTVAVCRPRILARVRRNCHLVNVWPVLIPISFFSSSSIRFSFLWRVPFSFSLYCSVP